ncbi:hypothetical protein AVEN_247697-1 [Araneus ventricosus]|uniref:Uncharacterized protein n=1 Tax=Araneus ventricosus TaxID=182803 RepID=A0A4Y2GKF2_ARAVE|nr:hypothetical protein AVEN_247697-1 [Araneus ventricosus]
MSSIKDNIHPTELFKILGQPEKGDHKEIALNTLNELYPQELIPFRRQPTFQHHIEKPFIQNELKRILQKAPTKQAPGYDAIDVVILKSKFKPFPNLLLSFYNILNLLCFPMPLEKNFLLNINGAYSTTPTADLQVIEGITLLHIKAQMESILGRVGRLRRDCNWEGSSFLCQNFQQPNPPLIIHPANFDLEERLSIVSDPHPPTEAIYTEDSHLGSETGCAFFVIQNKVQIH